MSKHSTRFQGARARVEIETQRFRRVLGAIRSCVDKERRFHGAVGAPGSLPRSAAACVARSAPGPTARIRAYWQRIASAFHLPDIAVVGRFSPASPRADFWVRLFGGPTVPLRSATRHAMVSPTGKLDMFQVHVEALPRDILQRLLEDGAQQLGRSPSFVLRTILARGMLIPAEDVSIEMGDVFPIVPPSNASGGVS